MSCFNCLSHEFRYKEIQTVGTGECDLLLVGDYPKDVDNISGYPYTGSEYQFLWKLLSQIGVSYYVTYIMKCIPINPATRRYVKPDWDMYGTCYETRFVKEVEFLKPKVIVFLGQNALEMYLKEESKLAPYRGIPKETMIGTHKTRIMATYSPSYISRNDVNEINVKQFYEDIVSASRYAQDNLDPVKTITINPDQLERIVDIWLKDPKIEYVAYDTETNGLDPLVKGAKITSFSLAVDETVGYNIFLYHPELDIPQSDRDRIIASAKKLLTTKKVVAHHAKHEHRYTKVIFGFTPNITEDTMYMSYILYLSDPSVSHGLKYLSGRFAGMPPWEEYISRYVDLFKSLNRSKTISEGKVTEWLKEYSDIDVTSVDIERFYQILKDPNYYIKQAESADTDIYMWMVPVRVMERYAGYDAVAPLKLTRVFKPSISADEGLSRAYRMMVKGAEAFANVELHGVRINDLDLWTKIYTQRLDEVLSHLRSFPEVQSYEIDSKEEYNPNSTSQSGDIFFKKFKFPVMGTTGKGNPSLSETTLIDLIKHYQDNEDEESKRRTDFLMTFREYKKLGKIMSGYLIGLRRFIKVNDAFDGHTCQYLPVKVEGEEYLCMHPGYLLHGTDCVVEGTLVRTEEGDVPIESLAIGPTPVKGFYPIKQVKVYDGKEYRIPLKFYNGGLRETFTVCTKSSEIVATPEHPLYLREIGWTPVSNLQIGDQIARYDDNDDIYYELVEDIRLSGIKQVYDITMDEYGDDNYV